MKKGILTTVLLLCGFMICFAIVTDLAGKWAGTLITPDGNELPLTYTFNTDSGKLTGTAESPQGVVAITGGKISGNTITFGVPVNGDTAMHAGVFYPEADSIGMDITYNGSKMHLTLKRDTVR